MKLPKEEQEIYNEYLEELHLTASLAETQKYKLGKAKKDVKEEGKLEEKFEIAKNFKDLGVEMEKNISSNGIKYRRNRKVIKIICFGRPYPHQMRIKIIEN